MLASNSVIGGPRTARRHHSLGPVHRRAGQQGDAGAHQALAHSRGTCHRRHGPRWKPHPLYRVSFAPRRVRSSAAAAAITERHAGCVPRTMDELTALPGVDARPPTSSWGCLRGGLRRGCGHPRCTRLPKTALDKHTDAWRLRADLMELPPQGRIGSSSQSRQCSMGVCVPGRTPRCQDCALSADCPFRSAGDAGSTPSTSGLVEVDLQANPSASRSAFRMSRFSRYRRRSARITALSGKYGRPGSSRTNPGSMGTGPRMSPATVRAQPWTT